jgi:hypothetical protein
VLTSDDGGAAEMAGLLRHRDVCCTTLDEVMVETPSKLPVLLERRGSLPRSNSATVHGSVRDKPAG